MHEERRDGDGEQQDERGNPQPAIERSRTVRRRALNPEHDEGRAVLRERSERKDADEQRIGIEQKRERPMKYPFASSGTPRSRLPSVTPKTTIRSALDSENTASQN